jgi:hypothetical protein
MKKFFFLFLFPLAISAQPFTKKYLLAFHTCTTNCAPNYHETHIAESNDGTSWTMVPNLPSLPGSVPDLIIRGTKLYLYNPGKLIRYDNTTATWETNYTNVSVLDSNGNPVMFVDPSPTLDANGNIVLFFLNSTGSTGDPAQCVNYPCTKYFDSATEVQGSDGTQFIMEPGHRLSVTISNGTASDPDIFSDGSQFILYYSSGTTTKAFSSSTLHGSYSAFSTLSNAVLTNQGGIPCGHFNTSSSQYWTYVHANGGGGATEIKRVMHSNFNSAVNTSTTVINGSSIGLTAQHKCESPGFCENTFILSGITEGEHSNLFSIFPNPVESGNFILSSLNENKINKVELMDYSGKIVKEIELKKQLTVEISCGELSAGIYFVRINSGKGVSVKKLFIL